jgi:hypothetical protein
VGTGAERDEPGSRDDRTEPVLLETRATVNGRIGRAGEVDRYRVHVASGEALTIQVVAAPLGSWLDSVLSVRESSGKLLGESDDTPSVRLGVASTDSRLTLPPNTEGDVVVSVTDRYGRGGPEFGYRLVFGPPAPEFRVQISVDPTAGPDGDAWGVVTLKPGAETRIVARVDRARPGGPVRLSVEGLPEGVECPAVLVRRFESPPSREGATTSSLGTARVVLVLRTAQGVRPAQGRLRVAATIAGESGGEIEQLAECPVVLCRAESPGIDAASVRRVTSIPFWVYTGE